MLKRDLIPVWVGILMMASFFMMGQDWGPSAVGGGIHVIDSQGNDVGISYAPDPYDSVVGIFGESLFDPSLGVLYRVHLWTGQTGPYIYNIEGAEGRSKYFESDDCSGPYYSAPYGPGKTFSFSDDPTTIYTVTAVENKTLHSSLMGGDCIPNNITMQFGSSFAAVTIPSSFPAPLHYEAR